MKTCHYFYTVVLMRGTKFDGQIWWDAEPETDCYVALVESTDKVQAVVDARQKALKADKRDLVAQFGERLIRALQLEPSDYTFIVLFEGHHDARLFGFQSGPWQL